MEENKKQIIGFVIALVLFIAGLVRIF